MYLCRDQYLSIRLICSQIRMGTSTIGLPLNETVCRDEMLIFASLRTAHASEEDNKKVGFPATRTRAGDGEKRKRDKEKKKKGEETGAEAEE